MSTLQDALPVIRSAAPAADARDCHGISLDGDDPFGAMITALMARQVRPSVANSILKGLRESGLLEPLHLDLAAAPELQDAITGKVRSFSLRTLGPAKQLARWIVERYEGRAEDLAASDRSTDDLRTELASIRGIGPTGADAILLLVLKRPAYPVDRGTYRILVRHGWLDVSAGQDEARDLLVNQADGEPGMLTGLSEGMDALATQYCRASAPRCDACPLRPFLPAGGPLGAGDE